MIVPMKKVSFVILEDKKEETLKKLRQLGMIQIEINEGPGSKIDQLKGQISLLENALFSLQEKKQKDIEVKEADTAAALLVAGEIQALEKEKKACLAQKAALEAELERFKGWGDIEPRSLTDLADQGVEILLYEMPKSEYKDWGTCVRVLSLEKTKTSVKFLIIKSGMDGESEVIDALTSYRAELPQVSPQTLRQEIAECSSRVEAIDGKIAAGAGYMSAIQNAIKACEKELEFEGYASGMLSENLSADNGDHCSVSYFQGYVEAENADLLKQKAKENAWGLVIEEPAEDDNVPTKLKNNKFVSLIYPLTDFLNTVPGYYEYDISGWFLMFILIFFGMIFGDGGYGLLICAIAAIPIIKALKAKTEVSPMFLLVGLFGLATVIWGTITCTWFGLPPEHLPEWLKHLSIPVLSNVYEDRIWSPFWMPAGEGLTTAQNMQIFCFALALIQLTVAHIKCIIRNRKSLKVLGDIGAVLQLWGMYYVVLSFVVSSAVFSFGLVIGGIPVGTVSLALVAIGFVMNFVFANYEGNIVKSILASLVNIVSVLLGVVNVFSDIVSYIRLWAVGLAGAAISSTVNELAGPLLGNFMFMVLAIILLVFGHGLNMILNILSVIVHGIRLNTLEFSSHLDMSWSGYKFRPFKE